MESMPADLMIWLKERKPKTALEVGEFVDDYVAARKYTREESERCHKCHQIGHIAAKCWNNVQRVRRRTVQSTLTKGGFNRNRIQLLHCSNSQDALIVTDCYTLP